MRNFKLASCKKCGMAGGALVVVGTLETVTGNPRQFYVLCMCREAEYFDTAEEAAEAWNNANAEPFHAPLHPLDTETQTFGCRQTNPSVCRNNRVPKVCAFVRRDHICLSPPRCWKRQFAKLKAKSLQ
jgi:hypothetical protein